MKNKLILPMVFGIIFLYTNTMVSQDLNKTESKNEIVVKKRTIMGKFESDLVLPADERIKLKKERLASIQKHKEIIDTLNISEKKKNKLIKDLYKNPFSTRLTKTISSLEVDKDE